MKLIDKEALLLALRKKRYSKQSLDLIESQPVVDAIPVEWMKKWHKEEDRRIGDGWTHVEHPHSFSRMVADWEKENEKDI